MEDCPVKQGIRISLEMDRRRWNMLIFRVVANKKVV
jgi:hypothetical protein